MSKKRPLDGGGHSDIRGFFSGGGGIGNQRQRVDVDGLDDDDDDGIVAWDHVLEESDDYGFAMEEEEDDLKVAAVAAAGHDKKDNVIINNNNNGNKVVIDLTESTDDSSMDGTDVAVLKDSHITLDEDEDAGDADAGDDGDENNSPNRPVKKPRTQPTSFHTFGDDRENINNKIDEALQGCPEYGEIIRQSSDATTSQPIPENSSNFVREMMEFLFEHPDVKSVVQGNHTFNLLWHWRRLDLAGYLHYIEVNFPIWAKILWKCIKRQTGDDGEAIIEYLELVSQSVPEIMRTQTYRRQDRQNDRFILYLHYLRGFPNNFHFGKVWEGNYMNYFALAEYADKRRSPMLPPDYSGSVPGPDDVLGVTFLCFDGDKIHTRGSGGVPDILRLVITNFTEIIGELVVCGHVSMGQRDGMSYYGDLHFRMPDEELFRQNFRNLVKDFDDIMAYESLEKAMKSNETFSKSAGWFQKQLETWGKLSDERQKYLKDNGFFDLVFRRKLLSAIRGNRSTNQNQPGYLGTYLLNEGGILPKQGKKRPNLFTPTGDLNPVGILCCLKLREKQGMAGLQRVINFAVSPQDPPLEPDSDFQCMYNLKVCRVRRNCVQAIEAVYDEVEARCNSNDRGLFAYNKKSGAAMTDTEIIESTAFVGWDVSEEGEAHFRDFLANMPDQRILIPARRPVVKFHTEDELANTGTRQLRQILQQEGVSRTADSERKPGMIAKILRHQSGRDMEGRHD